MSMISELVERLRRYARFSKFNNPSWSEAMKQAAGTIETLSLEVRIANADGGWIPCSERLPEDDTEVLVYVLDGIGIMVGKYCEETNHFEVYGTYGTVDVIAWQPLPPKYEQKEG